VMSRIRDEAPQGFIHLGDMMYADFEWFYEKDSEEVACRAAYRKAFVHDFDHRRLHESTAFFPMWDDHEIANNAAGGEADQAALFSRANAAATSYWVDRRVNTVAGGKGWWFDTAKCRFIMMDMRSAKHRGDPGATPPIPATMLGSTQMAALKALLEESAKPINILFSPGPVVRGHGSTGDPDGWNYTAMLPLRDELLAHFHTEHPSPENGWILLICSGDRHFTYVATDWGGTAYGGRIKEEWCSSPLAFRKRDSASLKNIVDFPTSGSSIIFRDDADPPGTVINRYAKLEINESLLIVTMSLVDGATQMPLDDDAVVTYTATA